MPINGLQCGTPYYRLPVGNRPAFIPLDNILNIDILHLLRFHCVLRSFFLDGEGTDMEEKIMRFSFSTPKEIAIGLKLIWELKMVTPSLASMIKAVHLALKAL